MNAIASQASTSAPSGMRARAARVLATVALAMIVVALGAGLFFGLGPLERRAAGLLVAQREQARAPSIRVVWPPLVGQDGAPVANTSWLPAQFQEQVLELATRSLARLPDPFSRQALDGLGADMLASGWYQRRPNVRRESGGLIIIDGAWRTPAAVVRQSGKDRLVAWDSRPMPPLYQIGRSGLPVILGVTVEPDLGPDQSIDFAAPWPGDEVRGALELLSLAARRPWGRQVAGVEILQEDGARRLALLTREQTRVVWGGPPAKPLLGESSTQAKLSTIDLLNREFKRIDAGRARVEVFWQGVPLVFDESASAQEQARKTPARSGGNP